MDRVGTANQVSLRSGGGTRDRFEIPATMKHVESGAGLLYEQLKQCHGDGGMIDAAKLLDAMNKA